MKETQQTVGQWTRDTFPQYESTTGRFTAVIEEMVEAGMAAGIPGKRILSIVQSVLYRELYGKDAEHEPNLREEIGDLYMNVLAFAEHVGVDAHAAMEDKMALNRSRPLEHYQKKVQEKIAAGIRPNQDPE